MKNTAIQSDHKEAFSQTHARAHVRRRYVMAKEEHRENGIWPLRCCRLRIIVRS